MKYDLKMQVLPDKLKIDFFPLHKTKILPNNALTDEGILGKMKALLDKS